MVEAGAAAQVLMDMAQVVLCTEAAAAEVAAA
jgi:hypothetical protein